MKGSRSRTAWVVVLTAGFWSVAVPAYAYLDPGSGSMLLQLLVGGVVASAVAVAAFWRRIWAGIRGLFGKRSTPAEKP